MLCHSVRMFAVAVSVLLAARAVEPVRADEPADEVRTQVEELGGQVVYGDATVGYAIVEVVFRGAGERVTPESLGSVAKLLATQPHLKRLTVASKLIHDEDLRIFTALPQLEDLQLDCHITGAGVAHLAGLQKLTSLGFFCSPELTDTALIQMKAMRQLKRIRLLATPRVTDTGLKLLRELPALEELTLQYTGVTAEGLDALNGFPALRRLTLTGSFGTPFRGERIQTLRTALPGCEIITK